MDLYRPIEKLATLGCIDHRNGIPGPDRVFDPDRHLIR